MEIKIELNMFFFVAYVAGLICSEGKSADIDEICKVSAKNQKHFAVSKDRFTNIHVIMIKILQLYQKTRLEILLLFLSPIADSILLFLSTTK